MRKLTIMFAVAGILCLPVRSMASSEGPGVAGAFLVFGLVGEGVAAVGGLVTGIGCGVSLGIHDEPKKGWIVPSYIFGGLNLVAGVVWFALSDGHAVPLAIGGSHVFVAAADITLSSVALAKRARYRREHETKAGPRLSLAPMITADLHGDPAYGMAVQIVGW